MTGGPFRDTLAPLIEDAQRQLAELRRRRAALEVRYEDARNRLDAKTQPPPAPALSEIDFEAQFRRELAQVPLPAFKIPFIAGLIVGLLSWFQIFGHPR